MLNQITRSNRGLLFIGVILAVAAFAVVVYVFQQKNTTNTSTPLATATPTVNALTPSPTATPVLQVVEAIQDVKAGTKLSNGALISAYFKDLPTNNVPTGAEPSIESMATKVLSATISIDKPIKRGNILYTSNYTILPFSPPSSLAYQIFAGKVAEVIAVPATAAVNGRILPGDFVDILLTLRTKELDAFASNPPTSSGPMSTQQLIPNVRVIATLPVGTYTVELSLQDALLLKYVKDSFGQVELVLRSSEDVRTQAPSANTNAITPDFYVTKGNVTKGTPGPNIGLLNPFATPKPTLTPVR